MANKKLHTLLNAAEKFNKLAQQMSMTTDDSLKKLVESRFGKPIKTKAEDILNDNPIWNMNIKINYNKPSATFEVDAMSAGPEGEQITKDFSEFLTKTYGRQVGALISQKAPGETAFSFPLFSGLSLD